jgi:hypothetical protein
MKPIKSHPPRVIQRGIYAVTNLLGQAINCDDGDAAAKLMQDALGVENNNVVNYCFPKIWPTDREQGAHIIGWLQTEARHLV